MLKLRATSHCNGLVYFTQAKASRPQWRACLCLRAEYGSQLCDMLHHIGLFGRAWRNHTTEGARWLITKCKWCVFDRIIYMVNTFFAKWPNKKKLFCLIDRLTFQSRSTNRASISIPASTATRIIHHGTPP